MQKESSQKNGPREFELLRCWSITFHFLTNNGYNIMRHKFIFKQSEMFVAFLHDSFALSDNIILACWDIGMRKIHSLCFIWMEMRCGTKNSIEIIHICLEDFPSNMLSTNKSWLLGDQDCWWSYSSRRNTTYRLYLYL